MIDERFVRICPQHSAPIYETDAGLRCPKGRHPVGKWKVVDRSKGLAISEADKEGEVAQLRERATVAEAAAKTVSRAKYADAAGGVLWMRIIRARAKLGCDPFRIMWTHIQKDGKKSCGCHSTATDEEQARAKFIAACAEAKKQDWVSAPITSGRLTFKPIPKAGAARR